MAYQGPVNTAELPLRPLTGDDAAAYSAVLAKAFLHDPAIDERKAWWRAEVEQGRSIGVFDGDRLAGGGVIMNRSVVLPGGNVVPFAAVSGISVASDYRRRGILTRIMRDQLHGLHEHGGEPLATLWASESRIYRRYGYGEASLTVRFRIPKGSQFRPGIELSPDPIRELDAAQARPLIEDLYAKALPNRVGRLSRGTHVWDGLFIDDPRDRGGMTEYRYAVHPEGYAVYRVGPGRDDNGPSGALDVDEIVSTTPQAHASLWRYVLDMDLVRTITGRFGSDDPVRQMLAEPQESTFKSEPAVWVRLVDLDRALPTRRYSAPLDVVIEVTDEFCPWNAGRWRLRVDGSGAAEVTRTQDAPDIATDILDLGAAFLGGTRLSTLAWTGRVRELTDGAVASTSMAFLGEYEPDTAEVF